MIKEIDRHPSIVKKAYSNQMVPLGINGGKASYWSSCKEEIFNLVGKAIGFNYDDLIMDFVQGYDKIDSPLELECPGIIFTLKSNKISTSSERISKIVNLLRDRQGLDKKPEVLLFKESNSCLITFDKWYYDSSVALSGLLTFIRAAANTDFDFESLDDFIINLIKLTNYSNDVEHIKASLANGNLAGFLNRALPIFANSGSVNWRKGFLSESPWDGIVNYSTNRSYQSLANLGHYLQSCNDFDDFDDFDDDEEDYDD